MKPRHRTLHSASLKAGSFRGVEIRLHITLLIVLPYLVYVARVRFNDLTRAALVQPGDLLMGPVGWGVAMAVALFTSILLHELGHVAVALRQGVRVRGITLMMLGGVSTMDEAPERPWEEFRMALIGPAISLAAAGVSWMIFLYSREPNVSFFTHWFAQVNLVLGIFNLLPAFPLDGGRALRSWLAVRRGRVQATRTAARLGSTLAWGLGILGVLGFNIFLILIAFFLNAAAQAELSMTLARELLEGLRVGDVATPAEPIDGEETLVRAISRMLRERRTLLPVMFGSGSYGILSLQQIRVVPPIFRNSMKVNELAQPAPRVLTDEELVTAILGELTATVAGVLPVVASERLVGYLRYSDLAELLQLRSLEKSIGETETAPPSRAA